MTVDEQVNFYRLAREFDGNAVTSAESIVNWFVSNGMKSSLSLARQELEVLLKNGEIVTYKCSLGDSLQDQFNHRREFCKAVVVRYDKGNSKLVVDTTDFIYWLYQTATGEVYEEEPKLQQSEKYRRLCTSFSRRLTAGD